MEMIIAVLVGMLGMLNIHSVVILMIVFAAWHVGEDKITFKIGDYFKTLTAFLTVGIIIGLIYHGW